MSTAGFHDARASLWGAITVFMVAMCLLVPSASAQTYTFVTVNCNTPGAGNYNSIHQALNNFSWVGMLEIEVTGTCRERVAIGDGTFAYNSVYIHPPFDGSRAAVVPPIGKEGTGNNFIIGGGHGIWIERLDIRGANYGVMVYDSSEVDFYDVTIENNANTGVVAEGNSIVYFGSSRIRNNGVYGVNISSQGSNTVYFQGGGVNNPESTVIEGNGQFGVNLGPVGVAWFAGSVILRNNGGASTAAMHGGIHAARNSAVFIEGKVNGATEITANVGPGILAEVNSSVSVAGASIHDNSEEGVRAKTYTVVELLGQNTFAGNGIANISCDAWALVTGDFTGIDLKSVVCKNVDLPPTPKK